MKVLLLKEFSGLHKNLKEGLLELGHEVVLASSGDGWKQIEADFSLGKKGISIDAKISRTLFPFANIYKLVNYDIVQLVNPFIFNDKINVAVLSLLSQLNKKMFLLAAGTDAVYVKQKDKFKYFPYDDYERAGLVMPHSSAKKVNIQKKVVDIVDGIIPVSYSYKIGYEGNEKLKNTIPLPINSSSIDYSDNVVKNKVVIFHGLSRDIFKGTEIIKKAMETIKQKYPNDVEIIIDGKMPLDKYLKFIHRTNIVIDQCKSYGYGMNALYCMAKGKVVLSGCEPEIIKELDLDCCPVINIKPSVNDIIKKIEKLIEHKELIKEIGYKSRKFVEENHDYIKIAEKYVNTWGK